AVGDHRPDVGDHLGDDLALAAGATDRTRPQRRGDHPCALAEELADVEFALHAALHPDDDQPATGGEGVDVAVEVFGTHDVEDHVGTTFAAHPLHEILIAVADGDLRAQFGAQVEFVPRPGGDGHPGTERACHLDAVRADAAGATVNEQQLTGGQVRGHHQVRPHRAGHFGQAGGVLQRHTVGKRHHLNGGDGDKLRVTPACQQSADLLPGGPLCDSVTDPGDGSGHLESEDLAGSRRGRIVAGGLQEVGAVDPRRTYLDEHFTAFRN